MKLKVLMEFHDKETDVLYSVNDVIEVSEKRGREILSSSLPLAEEVKEKKKKTTKKSTKA